jgi:Rha family phage regulatory protein
MNDMNSVEHLVRLEGDRLMTDSLCVARDANKRHKNVLRAYDNLKCSPEFNRHNFVPVEYLDQKGELRRMVKMTKDGFIMLVMGFIGEAAMDQAKRPGRRRKRRTLAGGQEIDWFR